MTGNNCTVKGCTKKLKARGCCASHYQRLLQYGDPLFTKQKLYELNGIRKTRTDWAKDIGISAVALNERLLRGWSVEAALTLPPQPRGGIRIKGQVVAQAPRAPQA